MQAQDHCLRSSNPRRDRKSLMLAKSALLGLLFTANCLGQTDTNQDATPFSQEAIDKLAAKSKTSGNFDRGLKVYTQAKAACFSCHKIGTAGGMIGPELFATTKQRTEAQLAESLLWPNRLIAPEFQVTKVLTSDGTQLSGYIVATESTDTVLALQDPATQKVTKLERADIESQGNGLSLMPNGLVDSLSFQDQADLLRFLTDLGKNSNVDLPAIEAAVKTASTHEPSKFPWVHEPLNSAFRPAWQEHVNRNRIYDFYSKQAAYFVKQKDRHDWLEEFPGLDGPDFGHWGNQNEAYWEGNEWNNALLGLVQCNVFISDRKPVPRAVCFRMGPDQNWSACFDPDTLSYVQFWSGGFVKFSQVRHGFIDGVRVVGTVAPLSERSGDIRTVLPELANAEVKYLGYFVNDNQILFHYLANGVEYIDAPTVVNGVFERVVAPKAEHPMRDLLSGGKSQSPTTIETKITLGTNKGLTVDTIALPIANPWNQVLSCGDHAFMSDGAAIVVTMQGDVWRGDGVAYDSKTANPKATWRRIAAGLHHALGVVVHDDQIYVLGRNQITLLHDLNGDLEVDRYECFSNAYETSPGGHDYICGLERDKQGYFYTASGNQGIVQISPDGKQAKVIAIGFRNPDGIGLLPNGTVTVPASEGDWTPTSMLSQILPKSVAANGQPQYEDSPAPFYGYRGPKKDQKINLPLVFLPRGVDNSSGGQLWVDDQRMGPLNNTLVHTSFGAGTAMVILRDKIGDDWQGAIVPLPGEYRAGVHRAKLNKKDGQLYLTGMNGWGTYTPDPGCFQRLRYTGDDIQLPTGFHVHANGIAVQFRKPIDKQVSENTSLQFAQCWNYRYSPGYGSKEYSVLHSPMVGHDRLNISGSYVLDGGKTLFLEIPDLQRCNQLHLRMQIGKDQTQELFATVHAMDSDRKDIPNYVAKSDKILLPHPMQRDLEWLERSIPNPWLGRLDQARAVRIESRDNLQFSTKTLEVVAGEKIKLTFANPDVVPHNWALIKPGKLDKIGNLTNKLVNDPDAYLRHYVPASEDVICYTDVVEPKGEFSIYFTAPSEPGKYPYLCTFPGHWMVMNGELIVKPK